MWCNSGYCVGSSSMLSTLGEDGETYKQVRITSRKVGDKIESRDKHNRRAPAEVTGLHRSTARGEYVRVVAHPQERKAGKLPHQLRALGINRPNHHLEVEVTPHHTFPICGGGEKMAMRLKAGDCLFTIDGEASVASAHRVPAPASTETFTVELEQGRKVFVANGILTHAGTLPRGGGA